MINKVNVKESNIFPLIPNKKTPMIKWSTERIRVEDFELYEDVAYAPEEGYVIVDADDEESVTQVEKLLSTLNLKVESYNTTRGKHFVFKLQNGEFFEKLGNTNGGSIFATKEEASKIDVKGNSKGYCKIRGGGVNRIDYTTLRQAFNIAPMCPLSLLLPRPLHITLQEYKTSPRDNTAFSWLPKLRAKGYTKENWVQLMIELKLIAGDPETIEETREWAEQKWDSSIQMGEVKDYISDEEEGVVSFKNGFSWVKVKGGYLAKDVDRFDVIADELISENNLQISEEDNQIWGIVDGVFSPIDNFENFIKRILVTKVDNIKPSIFGNIKSYLEGRIPVKKFSKNRFAVTFKNKTIDVSTLQEINLAGNMMNQNTIPHNYIGEDETGYKEEGKFLDEVMKGWTKDDDEIEKELYELIGLSMTKYMGFEKAYFLLGTGSNGKSWFLRFLIEILGTNNCSHEDLKDLSDNRFSSVELYGKLANINLDISANVIEDTSLFKKITSGDRIAGENKGLKKFRFSPYALQIYGTNNVPYARELGDSDAINRRLKIIMFNSIFSKKVSQKEIVNKERTLMSNKVIELAISRAIRAVNHALDNGLTESVVSRQALEEHKREMNHVITFVEESGIIDNEPMINAHKRYLKWAQQYNYRNTLELNGFVKKYENAARGLGYTLHKETFNESGASRHRIVLEKDE